VQGPATLQEDADRTDMHVQQLVALVADTGHHSASPAWPGSGNRGASFVHQPGGSVLSWIPVSFCRASFRISCAGDDCDWRSVVHEPESWPAWGYELVQAGDQSGTQMASRGWKQHLMTPTQPEGQVYVLRCRLPVFNSIPKAAEVLSRDPGDREEGLLVQIVTWPRIGLDVLGPRPSAVEH
jgi:hypothetical protein